MIAPASRVPLGARGPCWRLRFGVPLTAVLLALLLLPPEQSRAQTQAATLIVQVSDSVGRALAGARIHLEPLGLTTLTDSAGYLRLYNVPAGSVELLVNFFGHLPRDVRLRLASGRVHRVDVVLATDPVPVGELRVEVTDRRSQLDLLRGFEERRERGIGYFLTREDIEESGTSDLANLLHTVPGIRTSPSQFGESRIRSVRTPATRQCDIKIYVDGVEYRNGSDVVGIPTMDIEGIEIYRGRSELPAQFADLHSNCGAIVIWTRRFREPLR